VKRKIADMDQLKKSMFSFVKDFTGKHTTETNINNLWEKFETLWKKTSHPNRQAHVTANHGSTAK
jgi:hypothetical protein